MRSIIALSFLMLAPAFSLAMSNSVDYLTYSYYAGDRITNESFQLWFFSGTSGCRIRKSEDVGCQTKMIERTCCSESNNIPQLLGLKIKEIALGQTALKTNKESKLVFVVEAGAQVNGKLHVVGLTREEMVNENTQKLYVEMKGICSAMMTNLAYTMSMRQYYIDKTSAPAITANVSTVLSDPQRYVGKNVELTGYYTKCKEGGALFASPLDVADTKTGFSYPYKGVWVDSVCEKSSEKRLRQSGPEPVHVRILGMVYATFPDRPKSDRELDPFTNNRLSAGPLGSWPLEIIDVRQVTVLK